MSAENLCKQFGPRSAPAKGRDTFNFLTLRIPEIFFELIKKGQTSKKHAKLNTIYPWVLFCLLKKKDEFE